MKSYNESIIMTEEKLVKYLAELGNITRLKIYMFLIKVGHNGVPVGTIQDYLKIPASTLSHHISKLTNVGLISQKRNGRILNCIANFDVLQAVLDELQESCCSGIPSKK